MSVVFRECAQGRVGPISATAPSGYVIGVIGDNGSGKQTLLRLATGELAASTGQVEITAKPVVHYHSLALQDAAGRARTALALEDHRRGGGVAFVVSHELDLIEWLSDEVWWMHEGKLAAKGHPKEILNAYRRHTADRVKTLATGVTHALPPAIRRGDGRATLLLLETRDTQGQLASVWRAGEEAQIRVQVRFEAPVADPVIGILIRTRIGFEVYGTNTELENIALGPRHAGDTIEIVFRFLCHLCPNEYTVTAASHDKDGVWHDWVEDGVAVAVSDHRYTAGVARLISQVETKIL
ncbi:MAG: Wzt carbohydrate-binding domain-containing protein [Acidobacteria bacterium]|nr:Wzt carbohydrate-binding domain-containing protein [Acidobacteriota bacterium]